MTTKQQPLTASQAKALKVIADGGNIRREGAPNGNTCLSLWEKGLITGSGQTHSPYTLTDAGRKAL